MAISILRGKSYNFRDGLDEISNYWYVVGRTLIPIRVDKVLGWRDPGTHKPTFTQSEAYMVLPAYQPTDPFNDTLLPWTFSGDDVFFVPVFSVEQIIETIAEARAPKFIQAPVFSETYNIVLNYTNMQVQEMHPAPVRVDKILDWRSPLTAEEPTYTVADVGVCLPATFSGGNWVTTSSLTVNAPMFLATKVYTWGDACLCRGPQGPRGPQGAVGSTAGGGGVITGEVLGSGTVLGGPGTTGSTGATGGGGEPSG